VSQHNEWIFVPGQAYVYLGPVGTPAPVDAKAVPASPMLEVGYFTADSLKFSTNPQITDVVSHQSPYPTRPVESGGTAVVECDLQEWSSPNFVNTYGGGSVVEVSPATVPPTYKFSPPAIGGRVEKMGIVRVIDGLRAYMLIIPRCQQRDGASHQLKKAAESTLPLRLHVLGSGTGDPFYWLSNAPEFAPPA
jgi:hypothetical protein